MGYCTVDDVKDLGNITDTTDASTKLIVALIDRVSKKMEGYCDRIFSVNTYTEYYDGYGNDVLYTKQYPITSVSGIYEDTGREWADDTMVTLTDYFIDENCIRRRAGTFINYPISIKVVYTAGYTTIPYDITQVCASEVLRLFKRKLTPDVSSTTDQQGGQNVFITDSWLTANKNVLDTYKRVYCL